MTTIPSCSGDSLQQRMDALRPHAPFDMEQLMIYRLPMFLHHDGNRALFEPSTISIGPYYRGRSNLCVMEEYKLRYLRDFLSRNREVGLEDCIQEILLIETEGRECYNEVVDLSSTEFVEMLLLDGCFILELSLKYQEKAHDIKCRPGFLFDPIWMDLLLFENQIPFFVVEKLFSLVITKSHDSHELLVNTFTNLFLAKETLGPPLILRGKIHHLLHLYHELFVPRLESRCKSYKSNNCFPSLKILEEGNYRKKLVIPCATRLREAGVKFSYKRSYEHKFDIKFKRGVIEIPTLKIDSNHKPLYPNLIAFEVCLCYEYRTLSSYIVLLDLLINTREDVELLQRSGVIENTLPNEEEMADYLNLIGKGTYVDYCDHYFLDLFKDINAYYHLRWNTHRARLVHDYFSSPWTVISVFAAFILLILSFIQTFYSFYPYMK